MDYNRLCQKRDRFRANQDKIPKEALESFDRAFNVSFAHDSTAIEGNTLTLIQTKAIIEEGLSVGGKTLREIYEVTNHSKAFSYVKESISERKALNESIVKDIHAILMENILIMADKRIVYIKRQVDYMTPRQILI